LSWKKKGLTQRVKCWRELTSLHNALLTFMYSPGYNILGKIINMKFATLDKNIAQKMKNEILLLISLGIEKMGFSLIILKN